MSQEKQQENSFLNLLLNIIIPSIILIKFSTEDTLGPFYGLIIALAFPILYGIYDFIIRKDFNVLSLFGFISILLTGIISLVELDKMWVIVKETSIPLLIMIFMFMFKKKGLKFFRETFEQILNTKLILTKLSKEKYKSIFERYYELMTVPFIISAILNFTLAYILIKDNPGTVAYTQQLGKLTALSFPAIALPSMITLLLIIWLMFNQIKKETKLNFDQIISENSK